MPFRELSIAISCSLYIIRVVTGGNNCGKFKKRDYSKLRRIQTNCNIDDKDKHALFFA